MHFGRSATQLDRCCETGALRCSLDKVLGKTPQLEKLGPHEPLRSRVPSTRVWVRQAWS